MPRPDGVDSRKLRALLAVARSRSFSAAAHRLQMSVSGLRYQLDELERLIGVELFVQAPTGLMLTAAGQALAAGAARLLDDLDDLIAQARRAVPGVGAPLRVVAPWPVATGLLTPGAEPAGWAVGDWQLTVAGREAALAAVHRGEADVAVAADWQGDQVRPQGLAVRPLFSATHLLAVGTGSRHAARGAADLADTAGDTWVCPADGGARMYLDAQLAAVGLAPRLLACADSMEYMTLIDAGAAVGLAEPIVAAVVRPRTTLVPLSGGAPYRYFAAYPAAIGADARLTGLLNYLVHAGEHVLRRHG